MIQIMANEKEKGEGEQATINSGDSSARLGGGEKRVGPLEAGILPCFLRDATILLARTIERIRFIRPHTVRWCDMQRQCKFRCQTHCKGSSFDDRVMTLWRYCRAGGPSLAWLALTGVFWISG